MWNLQEVLDSFVGELAKLESDWIGAYDGELMKLIGLRRLSNGLFWWLLFVAVVTGWNIIKAQINLFF